MWTIFRKELLELSRDRKALIFTILMPTLIMPLLMGGFMTAMSMMMKKAQDEELKFAVFGQEHAPALVQAFAEAKGFKEVSLDSVEAIKPAIKDKRIKFALVIPADFPRRIAAQQPGAIDFHFNSAVSLNLVEKRVKEIVNAQGEALREQLFKELGLAGERARFAQKPIALTERSTADERADWGEKLGGILPYILFMICLGGSMYPAIDLGAGEKERGTLETLLLAPVARGELVLAKFAVLLVSGLTSVLLSVASMGLFALAFGQAIAASFLAKIVASIGIADLALVALMLAPVSAIFASLLLCLSIYAKSFKEAQNYMQPLMILMLPLILLAMLPGVELNWTWALVPITNVALAMKELLKGTVDYAMLAVIVGSTTAIAGGLLAFCRYWFNREAVLFRS